MRFAVLTFALLLLSIDNTHCAKILGIFHMQAFSHFSLGNRLMKELALRGHEVTMISPYEQKPPIKNYRDIIVDVDMPVDKKNLFKIEQMTFIERLQMIQDFSHKITNSTLSNPKVQKLLKSNEKFDLVIIEQFLNEAHRGFQHHFNAPCIMFSTIGSSGWTNHLVGNQALASYIPDIFSEFSGHMKLHERAINLFTRIFSELYMHLVTIPAQNKIMHEYFPDAPHIYDLIYNTDLILLNSHTSTNQPKPHTPNMIEIGGFHVNPPKKLPEELQKYLDEAKEGVIYFSMGSNLQSADLPAETRDALLKVFGQLKEKVLWKFEKDLPGKPKNVKIEKWMPQQDILAHPNVKVFITHGGLLSTIEAIYHGVPVIGIPIFADQKINMKNSVNNGFGIAVPYKELTEQNLLAAIKEILSNPKYRENAKLRSTIMHDQPIKPLDSAVFWVEHVLRHKGAKHFRSTALDLTWYQLYMLDVALILLAVASTPVVLIGLCIMKKHCCKNSCSNEQEKLKKKKKN